MKNEEILQAMLSVLAIDGTLGKQELQFFDKMCQELELSPEKKGDLLDDVRQGKGRIYIPDGTDERKQLLFYLIQAAFADGKIVPQEQRILQSAAHKMGIERALLNEYLQAMQQEIQASIRPATMSCPKCGFEQAKSGRCTRCGIFIRNFLKQRERRGVETPISGVSQTAPAKPRLSGMPLFTKHVGAQVSQFPKNYHCSWPLGSLHVHQEYLQLDLMFKTFILHYSTLTKIESVLFQVRIRHDDPETPKHVSISGYKLFHALKEANEQYGFDWPIA